jgi:hypothetical protein
MLAIGRLMEWCAGKNDNGRKSGVGRPGRMVQRWVGWQTSSFISGLVPLDIFIEPVRSSMPKSGEAG